MNNYIKIFSLSCIVMLLSACTKELPFPDATADPLLVVSSLFSPDTEFKVVISESCHLTQQNCENNSVDNATVTLMDNAGTIISSLENKGDGLYILTDHEIQYDKEYQLEVSSNRADLKSVSTKGRTPKKINSSLVSGVEQEISNNLVWAFEIEIEDDPAVENFYVIDGTFDFAGRHEDDFQSETNGYIEPHFSHYTDDPNSDNNELALGFDFVAYPLSNVYLPDKNFNGKTYKTTIGIRDDHIIFGGAKDVTAHITVKSVSKEMYSYLKSLEEHRLREANPFSEPVQVFRNIENGLGIFAGYSQQEFSMELPDSEFTFPRDIRINNEGCVAPCIVSFSSDGGTNLTYSWDFGDGQSAEGHTVEHTYSEAGEYDVNLDARTASQSGGVNFQITIN